MRVYHKSKLIDIRFKEGEKGNNSQASSKNNKFNPVAYEQNYFLLFFNLFTIHISSIQTLSR